MCQERNSCGRREVSVAQKHKQAANDLWLVRENYLSLLVDIAMKERLLEALQVCQDKLVEQLHTIYSGARVRPFEHIKRNRPCRNLRI
jgi:hypothetical protein